MVSIFPFERNNLFLYKTWKKLFNLLQTSFMCWLKEWFSSSMTPRNLMDETIYFMVKEPNGIWDIINNFSSWFKNGNRWIFCIKSKFICHELAYNGNHYIFVCNNELINVIPHEWRHLYHLQRFWSYQRDSN